MANPDDIRLQIVTLYQHSSMSQADIARELNVSRSMVTKVSSRYKYKIIFLQILEFFLRL